MMSWIVGRRRAAGWRMRSCVAGFALLLTWHPEAGAPPMPRATPESVGLSAGPLREATDLLARFVAERKIAGAVGAVARRGKVAYLAPVGLQSLDTRAPMTDRSIFRIYSMTKAVTAVAALTLWEEGHFDLKDPVSKFLPEIGAMQVRASDGSLRPPTRAMTIEDLMLHTSGLNHRTSDIYHQAKVRARTMTLPQFVTSIARVPLMEDPGTRYRYSEATTVLGRLIEIWSGQPLDRLLRQRVLEPLGMTDTSFWIQPVDRSRMTTVYSASTPGVLTPVEIEAVPFTERPPLLEGAVGLVSTAPDYLRFAQMLLNRGALDGSRVLKASTVEMITANRLDDGMVRARGGIGWGLLNVNLVLDPAAFPYPAQRGEYGWDGSAGTIFWVDPSLEMATVLMTQSVPPNPDTLRQRFKTLVQRAVAE